MPFTPVHPAIIIPVYSIKKRLFSLTGLIVGSIMPDFESFLRFEANKFYSHSFHGILWFSLPIGIILSFVFHQIIRDPLINSLPAFVQRKFAKYRGFNWPQFFSKHYLLVIISMLIGIASHFFWDGFSHFDGFVMHQFPELKRDTVIMGHTIEIPFLIQYLNTLAGLLILIITFFLLKGTRTKVIYPFNLLFWLFIAVISGLILWLRVTLMGREKFDDLLVSAISAVGIALIIVCGFYKAKKK